MAEPEQSAPEFDAANLGKHLLRTIRSGALATLDRATGFPFASLATVATDSDGSPLLLLSRLSAHTLNLEADARASLLLAESGKGDPLAHPRLTVTGRAGRTGKPEARSRFLARHPKAKLYADFGDFSFFRLEIAGAHLNGGFARAAALSAEAVLTDLSGAEDLLAGEADALARLNREAAEALDLCATRLCGARARSRNGRWQATGLDPEGLDLTSGDRTARLAFPEPVRNPDALTRVLQDLAERARATGT